MWYVVSTLPFSTHMHSPEKNQKQPKEEVLSWGQMSCRHPGGHSHKRPGSMVTTLNPGEACIGCGHPGRKARRSIPEAMLKRVALISSAFSEDVHHKTRCMYNQCCAFECLTEGDTITTTGSSFPQRGRMQEIILH